MTITMNNTRVLTIPEIERLLTAVTAVDFKALNTEETYQWVEDTLRALRYRQLKKAERGLVHRYLEKMTGYSRSQTTVLIQKFLTKAEVKLKEYRRFKMTRVYSDRDITLLAEVDEAHSWLSGPATKKILEREFVVFKKTQFASISHISPSHIYNLRGRPLYRNTVKVFVKTRPTQIPIGERRKPEPNGRPGFLRVDTVHQGDSPSGDKGVYHINLIDEVTQWEIVVCVEGISERWLLPALEAVLAQFPFVVLNFHADNGSEYINYQVAAMLNGLVIKLTRSRPRHSNDNGLAETKNGLIIRKHLGYGHIPQPHAGRINEWYQQWFNVYLNYHRPCGFRKAVILNVRTGKKKFIYPPEDYRTPYEYFRSLPNAEKYLQTNVTFEKLDQLAYAQSDTEFATQMNQAKRKLFTTINSH